MSRPNFIIAGASKSGTTALYRSLKEHPEIFLPKTKELHYFTYPEIAQRQSGHGDADTIKTINGSWDKYLSQYQGARPNHKAIGDISPSYLVYPVAAERIQSHLGQVKIIIILRNPVDKIFSQYCHLVRDGREFLSFPEALKEEKTRQSTGWSDMWLYRESGYYCERVSEFIQVFGKESVKVLFFEDFCKEPVKTLEEIRDFIGVSSGFQFQKPAKVNVSGRPKSLLVSRLLLNGPLYVWAKKYFPVQLGGMIRRFFLKLNTGTKPQITKELHHQLSLEYQEDINCLERLIDRQTNWKLPDNCQF